MKRSFSRVAIVNRGEAALRFIHAALELNREGERLHTIALYTEPDRHALFVREADEAWELGPAMVEGADGRRKVAYTDLSRLEEALRRTRAEAAWPGWGFVAERPDFAELCERLGVTFIGPSPAAIRALGDKIASKRLAEGLGIPLVPWAGAPAASEAEAARQAAELGFPVMVKATGGVGGRGVREAETPGTLPGALKSARAEAWKWFGQATVFLERRLDGVRHVDVQVVSDAWGGVWALPAREASIQRRHQKLVEESPVPGLSPAREAAMRRAAARLVQAVGYVGAAAVEFLYDPGSEDFWFLEANTRLEVEHGVSEVTTGLDLVKLQVHVARGGRLPGEPPAAAGHAVEVRLCAEDAESGFAPAPGTVARLKLPGGPGLRVDAGVAEGDLVPAEFDSMIAKVIAHGRDREEALGRLSRALAQTAVILRGGTTNKAFLLDLLDREEVRAGRLDVRFLDRLVARGSRARGATPSSPSCARRSRPTRPRPTGNGLASCPPRCGGGPRCAPRRRARWSCGRAGRPTPWSSVARPSTATGSRATASGWTSASSGSARPCASGASRPPSGAWSAAARPGACSRSCRDAPTSSRWRASPTRSPATRRGWWWRRRRPSSCRWRWGRGTRSRPGSRCWCSRP